METSGGAANIPAARRRHPMEARHHGSMAECVFCKIARGEIEAPVVLRDEISTAFLDHRPLFPGHCLLIPNRHIETLPELPAPLTGSLFANAQLLCAALEEGLGAEGSFVAINNRISQSVPHLHVHIVPRRHKDGLRGFFWPRSRYENEGAVESVRNSLRAAIERLKASSGSL